VSERHICEREKERDGPASEKPFSSLHLAAATRVGTHMLFERKKIKCEGRKKKKKSEQDI
jgi:hypothetical protein